MEDITVKLTRLEQLRANGSISEDEFIRLKNKIISDDLSGDETPAMRSLNHPDTDEDDKKKWVIPAGIALAAITAIFAFPLVYEGAGNECAAFEQSALNKISSKTNGSAGTQNAFTMGLVTLIQRASNGAFASSLAKSKNPNVPPALTCTLAYYEMLFGGKPPDLSGESKKSPGIASVIPSIPPPSIHSTASIHAQTRTLPVPRPDQKRTAKPALPGITPTQPPQSVSSPVAPPSYATSDSLKPIMRTHTLPPYPPISVRLNESGTTLMQVHITSEGNVDDCKVTTSSGSERLDSAACEFIRQHWRWQPPTSEGEPTTVNTTATVVWDLKEAK